MTAIDGSQPAPEIGMPCMRTTPHEPHVWQMSQTGWCACNGIAVPVVTDEMVEQVREDYAYVSDDLHDLRGREAEFDRWLAAHDAEVAAKAWDEGHRANWRTGPSSCQCSAWSSYWLHR